jgi:hypothetical protein
VRSAVAEIERREGGGSDVGVGVGAGARGAAVRFTVWSGIALRCGKERRGFYEGGQVDR